jgi:transcriptional regulator
LTATFLPLLYEPGVGAHGALLGHVARNNPHWQLAGADSLVILRGADGYISPSWYATKGEHGRVVPTWNYLTAHVHGPLVAHDDVEWLRSLVTKLTDRHEARFPRPWSVSDAPAAYVDGQLRAIVGVSLDITHIEAKAKLSQNRSVADQDGAITGLSSGTPAEHALAELMSTHSRETTT